MATSIHHGAPGSFKSFSLVQRFAIPALIKGRVVVSNVRGFDSLDRILEQFPETVFAETARLIYLETTTKQARLIMAGWYHWAPIGALIIIDEGQEIYPNRKDFKLESLDGFLCPDGFEVEQTNEPRPHDVFTAYDKQRHYQWDIFISTTNIAKIQTEIRQVTEFSYRHATLGGLFPWLKNYWNEHQHDPENSGKLPSHRIGSPLRYKADFRIFKCYKSTATGGVTESGAGQSIFKNPALLLPIFMFSACIVLFLYMFFFHVDSNLVEEPVKSNPSISTVPIQTAKDVIPSGVSASVSVVSGSEINKGSFLGYRLISIAYNNLNDLTKIKFNYLLNDVLYQIGLDYFASQGVKFVSKGLCSIVLITVDGQRFNVSCHTPEIVSCAVSIVSASLVSYRGCLTVAQVLNVQKSINTDLNIASSVKGVFP